MDQGCANPRTAHLNPAVHPRAIPRETTVVRGIFPNPSRLSTRPVHLSTSPLLLVTSGHDLCLKHTHRSAKTRPVTGGVNMATGCHGLWITSGQLRNGQEPG